MICVSTTVVCLCLPLRSRQDKSHSTEGHIFKPSDGDWRVSHNPFLWRGATWPEMDGGGGGETGDARQTDHWHALAPNHLRLACGGGRGVGGILRMSVVVEFMTKQCM